MSAVASRWYLYEALLESIPTSARVAAFHPGKRWLMLETDSGGIGLAQRFPLSAQLVGVPPLPDKAQSLIGRPLRQVAALAQSWNFQEAAVGMAALNAAGNSLSLIPDSPLSKARDEAEGSAFDFFLPRVKGKKVAVVGHFPGLERLANDCSLTILERKPQPGDLPDTAAEYILPEQDAVFITGTTFVNKTITRLLELARGVAVHIVGPTTPMNPLLFEHGVSSLSGVVATDSARLLKALQSDQCGGIFGQGVVKVNLVKEET